MKAILLLPLLILLLSQCENVPMDSKPPAQKPEKRMSAKIESLCVTAAYPLDKGKIDQAMMLVDSMRINGLDENVIARNDSLIRATYLRLFKRPFIKLSSDEIKDALSKMRVRKDDMTNMAFYYSKLNSKYDNVKEFGFYVAKPKTGVPVLRYRIKYADDSWLFIKYYDIKFDDRIVRIAPDYGNNIERENGYGGIWEWLDEAVDEEFITIDSISKSSDVKIRYNGSQYYHDRAVSDKELKAMREVIMAYYALGGI